MEIKEIVDKLLGSCASKGCATRDEEALISLTKRIKLVEELIGDIQYIARKDKESYEASVKAIGERADRFLRELKEELC
jgi:hypothetical protein